MKKLILLLLSLLIISTLSFGQSTLIEPNSNNGIMSKNVSTVLADPIGFSTPLSGAGTRLMWMPAKSAFRVGTVSGTQWDTGNIGLWSFASGINTIAFGQFSTAMGTTTTASGFAATALGSSTTASGSSSIAHGDNTTASGGSSTAMGSYSTATGDNSTSLGYFTTAKAYGSLSIGLFNDPITASSPGLSVATDPLFIIGNGSSINSLSNAMMVLKNGNVGVGLNAPTSKLDVSGNVISEGGSAGFRFNDRANNAKGYQWYASGGNAYLFRQHSSPTEVISVLENGNVGIGINTPADKFTIQTPSNTFGMTHTDGTVSLTSYIFNVLGVTAGVFGTKSNNTLILMSNGAFQAYLLANGNLGIGTSTPNEKLEVTGNIRSSNLNGTGKRPVYADANGTLTTAVTQYYSIQGIDLHPMNYAATNINNLVGYFNVPAVGLNANATALERLGASINLPDGASITSISFDCYDNSSTKNLNCNLIKMAKTAASPSFFATVSSSGSPATAFSNFVGNIIGTPTVIDNQNFYYFVSVGTIDSANNTNVSWDPNLIVRGVTIGYSFQ